MITLSHMEAAFWGLMLLWFGSCAGAAVVALVANARAHDAE